MAARTMVPPTRILPDVLPTERLNVRAMPTRPLRDDLRRIPTVRNVDHRRDGAGADVRRRHRRRRRRPLVGVAGGVRPDGPRPLPAQHPRPRGRPPPAVPEPPGQRLRRPLAARLPDVPGLLRLPPRPLRPPSRRDGPRRARPRRCTAATRSPPTRGTASCAGTCSARARGRTSRRSATASGGGSVEARQILAVQVVLLGASIAAGEPLAYLVWIGSWMHAVEVLQPAAGDRRARRDGALRRPPAHDPRHPPEPARPLLHGAVPHRLAPRPPRRHGRAVAQPAPAARRAGRAPAGSCRTIEYPSYRAFWRACSAG